MKCHDIIPFTIHFLKENISLKVSQVSFTEFLNTTKRLSLIRIMSKDNLLFVARQNVLFDVLYKQN